MLLPPCLGFLTREENPALLRWGSAQRSIHFFPYLRVVNFVESLFLHKNSSRVSLRIFAMSRWIHGTEALDQGGTAVRWHREYVDQESLLLVSRMCYKEPVSQVPAV